MQHLTPNSTLQNGKYRIIDFLGQGGFGITYLAIQSGLERKVAIKEFFMKELCERDESTSHVTLGTEGSRETVNRFREKFLKEARNIARLNHPNIVRIIDVFEENGTAYYVMEYAEGGSLADKVKREGNLSESVATRYILQVAHALDYIHERKMNHLDVKPANIMLNEKDECVLIDFGLSKQYDESGSQTSTTPVGISEGYAPMEQYMQGGVGEFSPETDIYALGTTFYKLLTGITPPNASFVNNEGLPLDELKAKGVSNKAISVIAQAMEGRKRDRMKSVRTFIDSLGTACTPAAITLKRTDQMQSVDEFLAVENAQPTSNPNEVDMLVQVDTKKENSNIWNCPKLDIENFLPRECVRLRSKRLPFFIIWVLALCWWIHFLFWFGWYSNIAVTASCILLIMICLFILTIVSCCVFPNTYIAKLITRIDFIENAYLKKDIRYVRFLRKGKIGIFDLCKNKVWKRADYDNIMVLDFHTILLHKEGKFGVIQTNTSIQIPPFYDFIEKHAKELLLSKSSGEKTIIQINER